MSPRFPGFPAEGIAFLRGLKKHNTRAWFQPRKEVYDQKVKAPMLDLVTALMQAMADFAPEYVNDPNKAIFRIYRDTRFSKDKTPYKTHIAAAFTLRGARRHSGAMYYFHVSPDDIWVGGGIHATTPENLLAIRNYLVEHHAEFRGVTSARNVRRLFGPLHGESLTRAPKGFDPHHSAADLLCMKQFLLSGPLDVSLATTPKLYRELLIRFEAITPFVAFLNRPLTRRSLSAIR